VLDAIGCERAAILAVSAGGPIGARYAARHLERVAALVLYGAFARVRWAEDYPIGADPKDSATKWPQPTPLGALLDQVDPVSRMDVGLGWYCPSVASDASAREAWARYQRMAASPGAAREFVSAATDLDVRDDLARISSPTLVLHPTRDQCAPVAFARDLAARISGATLVEMDSADHLIWFSDAIDAITAAIQTFLAPLVGRTSR
jgi:pimeloyl-ACP methyl ester carboxylesterase